MILLAFIWFSYSLTTTAWILRSTGSLRATFRWAKAGGKQRNRDASDCINSGFLCLPPQTLAGHVHGGIRERHANAPFMLWLRSAFAHYSRTTRLFTGRTARPAPRLRHKVPAIKSMSCPLLLRRGNLLKNFVKSFVFLRSFRK